MHINIFYLFSDPPQVVPTVIETVSTGEDAPDDLPDTPENRFIHRYLKQEADTLVCQIQDYAYV